MRCWLYTRIAQLVVQEVGLILKYSPEYGTVITGPNGERKPSGTHENISGDSNGLPGKWIKEEHVRQPKHQCILFGPVTLETSMTVTSDLELASLPVTINTRLTPFEHNIPLHLQRITHTWSWQIPSDRKVWRTHKDTTVTDRHNKPNWTSSDHPQSYW